MSFNKSSISTLTLFLVILLDGMGMSILFPILNTIIFDPAESILPVATNPESRNLYYSIILGAFFFCWFFGTAIISDLSDSIGRRKTLMICQLGSATGYLLMALAILYKSIFLLILGRIIDGFTMGSQPIAKAAIIDISRPADKAKNISLMLLAVSIGFIIGPVISGLLSNHGLIGWFNPAIPMEFTASLTVINILLLVLFFRDSKPPHKPLQISLRKAIKIFSSAFTTRTINRLSMAFLFFILGWSSFFSYVALFLYQAFQFSVSETGFYLAAIGLGFGVGSGYLVGFFSRYFKLSSIVIGGAFVTAMAILALAFSQSAIWPWLLAPLIGASGIMAYATFTSVFSSGVDERSQGWVMGITSSITAFGFSITALGEGYFASASPKLPLLLASTGLVIAGLMMIFINRLKVINQLNTDAIS
jgi:predicted MFS family arabinose efflux permease